MNETLKLSKKDANWTASLAEAYYGAPITRGGGETAQKISAREKFGAHSAKLAKRLFGVELATEEAFRSVEYHQTKWTIKNPGTREQRMDVLQKLLREGPNIYREMDPKALWSTIYFLHDYKNGPRPMATAECGSVGIKDTPRGLYRLLFLSKPKGCDFDDMYKTGEIFALCSADGKFAAHIELWKYELAIRWSATKEHITGRPSAVECGVPGSNNGVGCNSESMKRWCDLLVLSLESEWSVYSGNDFVV